MQQTKPLFIIRKYRSILLAAIIVESVSYIVSLTDSIVAGNALGGPAFSAIGLLAPFLSVSTFISSVVNSGTIMNYSYQIGSFDKRRAMEFFSQGIFMALLAGTVYAGILFACRDFILMRITGSELIRQYALDYYNTIIPIFILNPLSCLLDNMVIADGEERLSAGANVIQIVLNVLLSVLFVGNLGIKGVALASVLSKFLFVLIICFHFLSRKNTLQLIRYWKNRDCITIIRSGVVKASTFALEGLMVFLVNLFAIHYFDENTLILLVMIEKYLGLLAIFIGLSMAAQPLIGTLNGEKNHKALRYLMQTACRDMMRAGLILTVLTLIFAPFLVRAFGIKDSLLHAQGVTAIRIVSATLVLHALLILFFIYYYLLDRQLLAFVICAVKNVISPLVLAVLFSVLLKSHVGMWIGLAAAPVLATAVIARTLYARCPREEFPFLLPWDKDDKTYIFDFEISPENAVVISRTTDTVLHMFSKPESVCKLIGLFAEEMLILIQEKNADAKILAEFTIMVEPEGVRLILRDSGKVFDITEEDAKVDSFRQYVVANMMLSIDNKAYITTTGYNRNELFFPDPV